jgi:hypothetical protein
MGSRFDNWAYWHFFTITVNYYSSQLILTAEASLHSASRSKTDCKLSLSLMLRPTVSRPVYLGVKHPFGAYDQIFITCMTVTVLFLWGDLSDERSGLSFVCAAGPCQRSLPRVRVPWDLRPYFTVSDLRLPFRRLLRLAGSRWRYSTPPPHGIDCKRPSLSPINLRQGPRTENILRTPYPSNSCIVIETAILVLLPASPREYV